MAMTEEEFLKKQAKKRLSSQARKARLGAQAKKDIAKAEKEKTGISYTALTHPKHPQILKNALTQCKKQTGNA